MPFYNFLVIHDSTFNIYRNDEFIFKIWENYSDFLTILINLFEPNSMTWLLRQNGCFVINDDILTLLSWINKDIMSIKEYLNTNEHGDESWNKEHEDESWNKEHEDESQNKKQQFDSFVKHFYEYDNNPNNDERNIKNMFKTIFYNNFPDYLNNRINTNITSSDSVINMAEYKKQFKRGDIFFSEEKQKLFLIIQKSQIEDEWQWYYSTKSNIEQTWYAITKYVWNLQQDSTETYMKINNIPIETYIVN